ncbi:hypothetical protein KO525_17990 [Psychrosphaera sp. B3R10]|uniref:hypothetical protein n=1 Tax=unclassified Psychrosphaera TaxID=2641570 RepID=UPI001C09B78F|nr:MULTISPECIES: hypothetical protein [unclassified Psychrosphaera]MBU2881964.1 hypothetical protein [Psychrosphaera sp. I2R16]MBU2991275.1 hypothetical protein [Psychrosphaera sp. B3R10]
MFRILAAIAIVLTLASCSATKQKTVAKIDKNLIQTLTPQQWRLALEQFNQLGSIQVYGNYLDIIRSFDTVERNQICLPENQSRLIDAIRLNRTSLVATLSLYRCAVETKESAKAEQLLTNVKAIATQLIGENNGQTPRHAVKVREIDEAYVILDTAGFDLLGSEIILGEVGFIYKMHTFDRLTQKFRYQYFDNSEFMYAIHKSAISQPVSRQMSTNLALQTYREQSHAPIVLLDVKKLLNAKKVDEAQNVIDALGKPEHLRQLIAVARADIALQQHDLNALQQLIEPLVSYSERGSLEAHLTLIDTLLRYGETEEEFKQVDLSLEQIIKLSDQSTAYQLVLDNILSHPSPTQAVSGWWQATQNINIIQAVGKHYQPPVEARQAIPDNEIDLLKFASSKNDLNAMFILGKYFIQTADTSKQNELKGQELVQKSANLGFEPAKLFITEHHKL